MDLSFIVEIKAAIRSGNLVKTEQLLRSNLDVLNKLIPPVGSCLHIACRNKKLDIVKKILELGADVNVRDSNGRTALDIAACEGNFDIVKILLTQGAISDTDLPEKNPLFGAIIGGHTEIAKIIIEHGIDTTVKYSGKSMKDTDALAFAKQWGRSDIVSLLSGDQSMGRKTTTISLCGDDKLVMSQALAFGCDMLGIKDLSSREVFDRIETATWKKNRKTDSNTVTSMAITWGECIVKQSGWEWTRVKHGEWESIGIIDKQRKYLLLPIEYFNHLFKSKQSDITLTPELLANCILENNLTNQKENDFAILTESE